MLLSVISRELKLNSVNSGQVFNKIVFFFITISIFSISTGYFSDQTSNYNISIIWFCLIFSNILGMNNFLKDDFNDGTLEQIFIDSNALEIFISGKIFSNWLVYSLPLIICIPLAMIILGIDNISKIDMMLIALIVTLIINLIACFCSSLVVLLDKNEGLLTILILPLIVPVVIFANSAFFESNIINFQNSLLFLSLFFIFLAPILVFSSIFALRISFS